MLFVIDKADVVPDEVYCGADMIVMAKALTECPIRTVSGDSVTYLYCEYCDSELHGYEFSEKDFKHSAGCPVLIAEEVLRCR